MIVLDNSSKKINLFAQLPIEIVQLIFEYLTIQDLAQFLLVDKYLSTVAQKNLQTHRIGKKFGYSWRFFLSQTSPDFTITLEIMTAAYKSIASLEGKSSWQFSKCLYYFAGLIKLSGFKPLLLAKEWILKLKKLSYCKKEDMTLAAFCLAATEDLPTIYYLLEEISLRFDLFLNQTNTRQIDWTVSIRQQFDYPFIYFPITIRSSHIKKFFNDKWSKSTAKMQIVKRYYKALAGACSLDEKLPDSATYADYIEAAEEIEADKIAKRLLASVNCNPGSIAFSTVHNLCAPHDYQYWLRNISYVIKLLNLTESQTMAYLKDNAVSFSFPEKTHLLVYAASGLWPLIVEALELVPDEDLDDFLKLVVDNCQTINALWLEKTINPNNVKQLSLVKKYCHYLLDKALQLAKNFPQNTGSANRFDVPFSELINLAKELEQKIENKNQKNPQLKCIIS